MIALRDLVRMPRRRSPQAHCLRCGKPIVQPQTAVRLGAGALAHPGCATYQRADSQPDRP